MIKVKREQEMDPNKLSSEQIENKMVILTPETLSSEDWFETKIQAIFYKSDKCFEHPEEKLMNFREHQQQ